MKCSSQMLLNLLFFWNMKTHIVMIYHSLEENKTKHVMKNKQKTNVGPRTPKVWQILMCYSLEHSLYMHSTPTKKISKVCYI